jgi:hypothetical protein
MQHRTTRWRGPRAAGIVLVAIAASVLGACSSGGGGIALDTWRPKVDAVCVDAQHQVEGQRPVTGAGNPSVPVRARAQVIKDEAKKIDDIGDPDESTSEAHTFVDAMNDYGRALDRLAEALVKDPTAADGPAGEAATTASEKLKTASDALHLDSCAALASPTSSGDNSSTSSTGGVGGAVDES